MKLLRKIDGTTRMDRSEAIKNKLNAESLLEKIESQQLRWFGYSVRMGDNKPVKENRKQKEGTDDIKTWNN